MLGVRVCSPTLATACSPPPPPLPPLAPPPPPPPGHVAEPLRPECSALLRLYCSVPRWVCADAPLEDGEPLMPWLALRTGLPPGAPPSPPSCRPEVDARRAEALVSSPDHSRSRSLQHRLKRAVPDSTPVPLTSCGKDHVSYLAHSPTWNIEYRPKHTQSFRVFKGGKGQSTISSYASNVVLNGIFLSLTHSMCNATFTHLMLSSSLASTQLGTSQPGRHMGGERWRLLNNLPRDPPWVLVGLLHPILTSLEKAAYLPSVSQAFLLAVALGLNCHQ